jgi:DNA mismatch endonuclease, patch repair protein
VTDIMSPGQRSRHMALIKGKDTKPEMQLRRHLHRLGYRYRLHRRELPGKPDIVFPTRRRLIYVHGCFWHQHRNCKVAHLPKSRSDYWAEKFRRNTERDAQNLAAAHALGWETMVVWECELRNTSTLEEAVVRFLGAPGRPRNKPGAATAADS